MQILLKYGTNPRKAVVIAKERINSDSKRIYNGVAQLLTNFGSRLQTTPESN